MAAEVLSFGPFRCDPRNALMWRDEQTVSLPPKALEVLLYLLRHPGQLVNKEELLKTIWAETYVGDAVLKVAIGEIRKALADDPKKPQFVETVHRRGYRWLAPLRAASPAQESGVRSQEPVRTAQNDVDRYRDHTVVLPTPDPRPLSPVLVGREAELAQLHAVWAKALSGHRQVVFVTGEPGIGKTTLIEAFLSEASQGVRSWRGRSAKSRKQKAKRKNL